MTRPSWVAPQGMAQERFADSSAGNWQGAELKPHVQGAVAVWAQEGLEELLHVQGQEGQR